jgi:DNA mismatch endonuclease (patch repair protein)
MRGNKARDTRPELALRSALHRQGLRFRCDREIRMDDVRVRPDVVFVARRVAIFLDGCYWHRCPQHGTAPRTNAGYWTEKLDRNVARDRRVDAALDAAGWRVVRIWEHESVVDAVDAVLQALKDVG